MAYEYSPESLAVEVSSVRDEFGQLLFDVWLQTLEDDELRREISRYSLRVSSADAIRAAFVILENRLRSAIGASRSRSGTQLVAAALEPQNGILQPVSEDGGEKRGFHDIVAGAFMLYRNSAAHQSTQFGEAEARRILGLVDHCLKLVAAAIETAIPLSRFVGEHEGEIRQRRDFRLDIDNDGRAEIVIMLGHGPVIEDDAEDSHFSTVILKESEGGFRRINAARVAGWSLHGPISVVLRHCTDRVTPDLVVTWTIGETQELVYVLRRVGEQFEIALRDIAKAGEEHYNRPFVTGFANHAVWNSLDFRDIDGDGIDELIRNSRFPAEDLPPDAPARRSRESDPPVRRRSSVWKWNPETERFEVLRNVWVAKS